MSNVLFIMCDQLRFDCIASLGNTIVKTPNIDRLVRRGASFTNAYTSCPLCMPARYTINTGLTPFSTAITTNDVSEYSKNQVSGKYIASYMQKQGFRTFGIGKFHTDPYNEPLGFEKHLYSEEIYLNGCEYKDDYYNFIRTNHPEFDFIEQLHGERSEMYYQPQISMLPEDITVENWVANRAVEELDSKDPRPFFGYVSFIGPHPPFAPPIPYNRMYDPNLMPVSVNGDLLNDHVDEYLPFMNHLVYTESVSESQIRILKSRYYGEISYIDNCLGKILDKLETRKDANDTMIIFCSDHGDLLGDHNSWQKESFFESSCHIPMLVSLPGEIEAGTKCNSLVTLEDIFATISSCSGNPEYREGLDLIDVINEKENKDYIFGIATYGEFFKAMIFDGKYKLIYFSNGGKLQLFNLEYDRDEKENVAEKYSEITKKLIDILIERIKLSTNFECYLKNNQLIQHNYTVLPKMRLKQMACWNGIYDYTVRKVN